MGTGIRDLRDIMSGLRGDPLSSDQITMSNGSNSQSIISENNFIGIQDILLAPNAPARTPSPSVGSTLDYGINSQTIIAQDNLLDLQTIPPFSIPLAPGSDSVSSLNLIAEMDSSEDSDIVLTYINQMLMEEDIDEKYDQYPENPALLAVEKPFLEILREKSPTSPDQPPLYSNHSSNSPDSAGNSYGNFNGNSSGGVVLHNSWPYDPIEYDQLQKHPLSVDYTLHSSVSSAKSTGNIFEGLEESIGSMVAAPDIFTQSQPVWQFRRGVEEAQKFLPSEDKLVIDLEASGFSLPREVREERKLIKVESEEYQVHRGRKNPHRDELDVEEGRSNKQSALYTEETLHEMFDKVLLHNGETCTNDVVQLQAALKSEVMKHSHKSNSKGSGNGKGRGKKQSAKEVVDLRTLLIHCAQSVATDDRRSAEELLKQIRQHSSPDGDANQRLAHCFADGLQARLAGTGSQQYHSLMAKRASAADVLKAYQLFMAACPIKKISYSYTNQTIAEITEKANKVHIIDYGIYYGFQWPCLIQRLSNRPGGPPRLRITGIDLPQPGFRPAERIEETGRRLAGYAKRFNVPFEYHPIAAKWETIQIEDLKIEKDEFLVVNCLYRLRNLMDETVEVDSPRSMVLNTIKKMNPDLFVHAIVNGSYSAPFFSTRFREALFHFSALFDMLEANVPRENEQRMLIERTIFGRDALNVISCEGTERVERPETYKQWQVRHLRAGFKQLPLNANLMKIAREKVKLCYHKDFVIDEDNRWLLQGWKGRILYALSTWKPNKAS
ncbi:scarecrow-like protein 9 [Typha latifolia]|uniref:scarecrow-like protein 9 n=1 Tax=Typha latifolia TaxID=4733 RepID=UPI003C2AB4C1